MILFFKKIYRDSRRLYGFDDDQRFARGFTLIEVIVAMAIFSVILLILSETFVQTLNAERRALNIQQVEENISFALESMAKEVRLSTIDVSTANNTCPDNQLTELGMTNQDGDHVRYFVSDDGTLHRSVKLGDGSDDDRILSSNAVVFDKLGFCAQGIGADGIIPKITFLGRVHSANSHQEASLEFQTTVASRLLVD